MMDEIFEARRRKLEAELKTAALNLFQHMGGASSVLLPLAESGALVVAAGPKDQVAALVGGA